MAWIVEDRQRGLTQGRSEPYLTDALKQELSAKYFPRYPSKRAVLLPALHAVQHEYNWIPTQAMEEIAQFLEIAPAEVMDTATFYEEYWLRPKGKYLIQVCRSLSCEICQSEELTERCRRRLGIDIGETTADGRFTLVELECLGACGTAPVALVNEALYEDLTPDRLDEIISGLPDDPHHFKDETIDWETSDSSGGHGGHAAADPSHGGRDPDETRDASV